MFLGIKTYKCHSCGKEFTVMVGGVVCETTPLVGKKCPHCGSKKTRQKL